MKKLFYYTLTAMLFSFGGLWAQEIGNFYGSLDGTESIDLTLGKNGGGSSFKLLTEDPGGSTYFRLHARRYGAGYTWSRESSGGADRKIGYLYGSSSGQYFQLFHHDQSVKVQLHSNGDSYFNSGNVGIGTPTPDMRLSVYSGESSVTRFHHSGSSTISGIRIGRSASFGDVINLSSGFGIGAGTSSGNLPLSSQNTNHIDFFIDNSSNHIGIGTITPDMRLSVYSSESSVTRFHHSGSSTVSGIRIGRSASFGDIINLSSGFGIGAGTSGGNLPLSSQNTDHVDFFISNTNGNVGIGTTSPSSTLDVDGNIHMNGGVLQFYRLYENYGNVMVFRTKDNNQYGDFRFEAERTDDTSLRKLMFLDGGRGGLGIGTEVIPNGYKLAVDGKAIAEEVKVQLSENWPDFVFHKDYTLPTLTEVETHIKENGHLKDIPNEAEVKANGINLGEMDAKLLQKIEELTLYTIAQDKTLKEQQKRIETQTEQLSQQQQEIQTLKKENKALKSLSERLAAIEKQLKSNH